MPVDARLWGDRPADEAQRIAQGRLSNVRDPRERLAGMREDIARAEYAAAQEAADAERQAARGEWLATLPGTEQAEPGRAKAVVFSFSGNGAALSWRELDHQRHRGRGEVRRYLTTDEFTQLRA